MGTGTETTETEAARLGGAPVSVVIPTIKYRVRTVESIPEGVEFSVYGDQAGTLSEARNMGVRLADAETVVIMDDDIAFSEALFWDVVERVDGETLVGMRDWDFDLVAGRVMAFRKSLWEAVGGFDERLGSHMADSDFAIKAAKAGYSIEQIPQDAIDHEDHERTITTTDRAWRLAYLCAKHPTWAPRLVGAMVA